MAGVSSGFSCPFSTWRFFLLGGIVALADWRMGRWVSAAGGRGNARVWKASTPLLGAPEAAFVHAATGVEGVLDGGPADAAKSAGGEATASGRRRGLPAPVPALALESVALLHLLVLDVDNLHQLPLEGGDLLPVLVQDLVGLRLDPLLHLSLELPFLSLDAAGAVARVGVEDLQQVLDFDVLEVLWREVFQNLGQFVQQKLFESWVIFDFFNPVLKMSVKILSFFEIKEDLDSSTNFEKS